MSIFPIDSTRPGSVVRRLPAGIAMVVAALLVDACLPGPAYSYDRGFVASLEGYRAGTALCGTFIVYYGDRGGKLAVEVERIACESADAIASDIGLERISPVAIIIAPDAASFGRLHGGRLPEWGEAFSDSRRMIIGIDASRVLLSNRPLRTVVRHELSHILFAQRTALARCPTWFLEGLAMRQSREWTMGDQWRLALTVARGEMPRLEDLGGRFPKSAGGAASAYRTSYAAVDLLLGGEGRNLVTFTAFLRDSGDFERSFMLTFGETVDEFSGRFEAVMRSRYHGTALLLNISPYGVGLSLLFLAVYLVKKGRNRRRIREWEREDRGI